MKKATFFKRITKDTSTYTVAFYNLENLFDTKDNKRTLDDDFLPNSEKQWTPKKYESKLFKLGKAISNVGFDKTGRPPSIIGLAEVENKNVVIDLIESKHLKNKNYGVVHYDSPDERGIDTALIYQKDTFEVKDTKTIPLLLFNEFGERDYTRDVLHVTGELNKERIHVLVNHWPSRRSGTADTSSKRIAAAQNVKQVVEEIQDQEEDPGILIMGDFNDDPHSESIKNHLITSTLINPMERLLGQDRGSLSYKKQWNLFDQIILSHNFLKMQRGTHHFAHADIFDKRFLAEWKGSYKGNPFRTYVGRKYLGGYSDHFPVYVQLKYTQPH